MEASNNAEYTEMIEARISPFIQRIMRQKRITGLSIALVDEQGVLAAKGFGFADKQNQQPATSHTVYKIGSITKLFTGTAAMQLHERGQLDLDEPVIEYLPEFSIKARPESISQITPRTLMTHHSGLPADWYANYWSDDPRAFRRVIDYLRECTPAFPPNTVFSYSNLATSLMGIIIERVSHLSYQEYIEQNILIPLKMSVSALTAENVSPVLLSKAYARGQEVEDPVLRDAPAGAILSNVQEMSHFLSMVLASGSYEGTSILKRDSLEEMLSPQNRDIPLDLGFQIGLNWLLGRPTLASAGRVCWHDGGSPHFFSMLVALPDVKLGAVVLSNSDGGMINVGLIADEMLKQAITVKTGSRTQISEKQSIAPNPKVDANGELPTGTFASANEIVQIFPHKDAYRAKMQGMQFKLTPEPDGWYALRLLLLGWLPVKIASVESLRLTVRTIEDQRILGMEQHGIRAPFGVEYAPVDIPTAWATSLGQYHLTTPDKLPPFTALNLKIDRGVLFLQVTARKVGKMSLVLHPTSDSKATVLGFGRIGGVRVELSQRNGTQMLKMVGLEFTKS